MLTSYESYLIEALEKCQEELKKTKEELSYQLYKLGKGEKDIEYYKGLWRSSYEKCEKLEKQLEEKMESAAPTANPNEIANRDTGLSIVKGQENAVKEAV